jgi:hypothetical protein
MAKQRGGNKALFGGLGALLVIGVIVVIVLAALGYFNKKSGSSGSGKISPIPYTPGVGPSPSSNYYFKLSKIELEKGFGPSGQCAAGVGIQVDTNVPGGVINTATVEFNFTGNPGYFRTIDMGSNVVNGASYNTPFDTNFPPPTGCDSVKLLVTLNDGTTLVNQQIPWTMPPVSRIC